MSARIPLIFGTGSLGAAGKNAVRVSEVATAQSLIDAYTKKYAEMDSARLYGDGTTEPLLAQLDLHGASVDTKVHPLDPGGHEPKSLRATVEASTQFLHPHKIRTLYLHAPDRRVSFEDTLHEIDALHKEGKFESFGLSNFPSWEMVEVIHICKANGWVQPTVYQGPYNAISRDIEAELIPAARKFGLRIVIFNPLAAGFFTGRIASKDTALDKDDYFHPDNGWVGPALRRRYFHDGQFKAMEVIKEVVEKHNLTMVEIGHRWLQHHSLLQPGDGIIFGASTVEHLDKNIENSEKGPLPEEVVDAVNVANKIVGSDSPQYWR
ncbi:Aldo/keto reductase [Artomyces pyxidatus]|uniref:Aldo/keto reductase n=1 Tax=Artomyces pyxidatus TaxID=48021 RepID=A0ACB8T8J6_9AGAM|nr:Aldo/keto reductase [Artomyces pyxidatus]